MQRALLKETQENFCEWKDIPRSWARKLTGSVAVWLNGDPQW